MRSVIQEWAMELPLRMQSTMLLAMRGPDGCSKHNTAKVLLRQLRAAVLVPAFPGRPDSFMGDQSGYCAWDDAEAFLDDHDAFPHHWLMHFIHAAEIVGQFHPNDAIRGFWWRFYLALCETFHMRNENLDELLQRLADPVEA